MTSALLPILGGLSILLAGLVIYLLQKQSRLTHNDQESQTVYLSLQQRMDNLQNQLRVNLDGNTQLIQQQVGLLTKQIDERLSQNMKMAQESGKQIGDRLDNAARFFGEIQKGLGKLSESNEKIYGIGKDIAGLQEILRNPKHRGAMGELFLSNLLSEMLPADRFELQYGFKNNEKVDAVIKLGEFLIPIDSKFPLENFRRLLEATEDVDKKNHKRTFVSDVKKHIDSISKKYILPDEKTFDFAFMYIPAENVFYEVIMKDHNEGEEESLQAYALRKRVIAVSPNSFYSYLGALMHALRGEKLQQNVMEIVAQIRHLMIELGKFRDDYDKVGYHLNNLKNCYESSEKRLTRYQDRLGKIQDMEGIQEKGAALKLVEGEKI